MLVGSAKFNPSTERLLRGTGSTIEMIRFRSSNALSSNKAPGKRPVFYIFIIYIFLQLQTVDVKKYSLFALQKLRPSIICVPLPAVQTNDEDFVRCAMSKKLCWTSSTHILQLSQKSVSLPFGNSAIWSTLPPKNTPDKLVLLMNPWQLERSAWSSNNIWLFLRPPLFQISCTWT